MSVHRTALTRHMLALSDPQNLRPARDPDDLNAERPEQARAELNGLLAQAVAGGLADRDVVERALLRGDAVERLQACRLVAAHLPGDVAASPLAVDWLLAV